jgi:excisionase family DNA binding protein
MHVVVRPYGRWHGEAALVAHVPIHPRRAAEILEQAQIGDPYVVIANACEGGVIKGYAASTRTIYTDGRSELVRDRRIPSSDWRRIIAEGKVADIATATVRLEGSTAFDGGPKVTMIEIGFGERGLRDYVDRHGRQQPDQPGGGSQSSPPDPLPASPVSPVSSSRAIVQPAISASEQVAGLPLFDAPANAPKNRQPMPVSPDALMLTIKQACAVTNLSRTTIYQLAKDGGLTIIKVRGRSMISREDIERLMQTRAKGG